MNVKRSIVQVLSTWKELGLSQALTPLGPWPVEDNVGCRLAIAQLRYSQNEGVNTKRQLQYDTV